MDNNFEYIEFAITDEQKFNDMKYVYGLIALSKNSRQPKSEEYWRGVFPEYSLQHFPSLKGEVKPNLATASENKNSWRFLAIIDHLQDDLDVELLECKRIENGGRIEFSANGYPYGGITGLTLFLNSFDCKAYKIFDGGAVYSVHWISDTEFNCKEVPGSAINALP